MASNSVITNPFDTPLSQQTESGLRDPWSTFVMLSADRKKKIYVPGTSAVEVSPKIKEDSIPVDEEDGTTTTLLGYDAAEVRVAIQLWERAQFDQLLNVLKLFLPRPTLSKDGKTNLNKQQPAIECIHPKLEMYEITHLYIFEIQDMPFNAAEGYRLTISMRQWWKSTKKSKTAGKLGSVQIPIPSVATIATVGTTPLKPDNKAVGDVPDPSKVPILPK